MKNHLKNKIEKLKNIRFNFIEMIIVLIVSLILGLILGQILLKPTVKKEKTLDFCGETEIDKVYNILLNEYYENIKKEDLENAAIKGMMDLLNDKYSTYLTIEEQEAFNQLLDGTYHGIGIQMIKEDDNIIITAVFEDSPASKKGFKPGDIILSIDKEDMTNKELEEVQNTVKSKKGELEFIVLRNNEEKTIKVKSEIISLPSVYKEVYETDNKKVGYLRVSIFASNTDEQFEEKLQELKKENIKDIIIDLRDNTGGHLDTASNIIDLFLSKDDIMYQIKKDNKITKYKGTKEEEKNLNIVILTNENSASASEILTSALKEQYGATIVGEKTYGKGTVQQAITLQTGAMIKYTTEEWLTPNGNSINNIGIVPDVEIELNESYFETYEDKDDNQLQKAISVLQNK